MTVFAALREEVQRRRQDAEFPEWLLPTIAKVANHPERFQEHLPQVERLLDQVQFFDPYAGAGCFSAAASLADIEKTLARLIGETEPGAQGRTD